MWLWLLTQTALQASALQLPNLIIPQALAQDTSSGPTSEEEAGILWKDGEAAFKSEDYPKAITLLQRLVDRYPGHEGYLEAHRYVGRAYLFNHQAEKSIAPFQYYITATGDRNLALRTRIWLAEAYIELGKFHEALLSAQEVEKTKDAAPELFAEAELIKARALLSLQENERAGRVYDAVREKTIIQSDSELKSQAELINLELKVRECKKLPSKTEKKLGELEVRRLFARRSLCLQEALVETKNVLDPAVEAKNALTSINAFKTLLRGFSEYNVAVKNPPSSPEARKLNAAQNKQYKAELVDILEQDRVKAYLDANSTVASWQKTDPASSIYKLLSEELEKLSRQS
jgi:tetratricopeptide (TPR) repeat protein